MEHLDQRCTNSSQYQRVVLKTGRCSGQARDAKQHELRQRALDPALVDSRILTVRGEKVMLDVDLAAVYGVATKAFNQAVKRNIERFPPDFRFQLTQAERAEVVTNCDHLAQLKFSPVRAWAFTEHGAVMAATILNSPRAVEMSLFVVRAFVRLRDMARNHAALAVKLDALERKVAGHDADLKQMFAALRALIAPGRQSRRPIGFRL